MPLRSVLVREIEILTGEKWDGVELLPPVVGDLDSTVVSFVITDSESLAIGVDDELGDVVWVKSIHDVEVVCAVGHASLGELVGQIALELRIALELFLEVLDAEFIESGDVDIPHVVLLE